MTSAPYFKLSDLRSPDAGAQHLIDPQSCFRCNSCESVCPSGAISHRSNYAIDASLCTACGECILDCPTGAIDHWLALDARPAFTVEEQFTWNELPELPPADQAATPHATPTEHRHPAAPRSAPAARLHLYGPQNPLIVHVAANRRLTPDAAGTAVHHLVLQPPSGAFPVLEGQTLGVIPPGCDADGRPHFARAYSIASARDGETPGAGDIALTVKRVTAADSGGAAGVASNHLCDLRPGDPVRIVGPFGASFLMPEDPRSRLLMICTGTGIAPMRAMIQRRLRLQTPLPGALSLYYGGRTLAEMAYVDELRSAAGQGLDLQLAVSRQPGAPRRHVQHLILERAGDILAQLDDPDTCIYLCGLRAMESGIDAAFGEICRSAGRDWPDLAAQLRREGRLHIETY